MAVLRESRYDPEREKNEKTKEKKTVNGKKTDRMSILLFNVLSPQRLQPGVSKYTRLHYGICDPGVPEFVAYRKSVSMSRRTGGLALTGWSARMSISIKNP